MLKPELATYADLQAGQLLDGRLTCTTGLDPYTNPHDVFLNVTAVRRTMRILGIGELVLAGEQGEADNTVPMGVQVNVDGTMSATAGKVKSAALASTAIDGGPAREHYPWMFWPQATVTLNRAAASSRISDEIAPGRRQKTREQAWGRVLDEVLRRGMLDAGSKILSTDVPPTLAAYVIPPLTALGACAGDNYTFTFGSLMYAATHGVTYLLAKGSNRTDQMRWSTLPFGAQIDRRAVGWGYAHLHQYAGARKQ